MIIVLVLYMLGGSRILASSRFLLCIHNIEIYMNILRRSSLG